MNHSKYRFLAYVAASIPAMIGIYEYSVYKLNSPSEKAIDRLLQEQVKKAGKALESISNQDPKELETTNHRPIPRR